MQTVHDDKLKALSGTVVTLQQLIDLRHAAVHQSPASIKKRLMMAGQKLSSIRGRGLEFDATREYQPGDDIRSMAWRVTARCLKPHIKVYREEKERSAWLALDLSPSQYFGTRRMFKSVQTIMQAAQTGWHSLHKGERIGAMLAPSAKPQIYLPQSGDKNYLAILNAMTECSRLQPEFNDENYLNALLLALQQQARSGNMVYLYSDFFQFDTDTEKLLLHLARRTHLVMNFVFDPFEALPPPPHLYMLTNGKQKIAFNMRDTDNREAYQQQFQTKLDYLIDFTRKHQIVFNVYCTDTERGVEI